MEEKYRKTRKESGISHFIQRTGISLYPNQEACDSPAATLGCL